MLSVERVKKLLDDPLLTDQEAEEIRDNLRFLAEVIFDSWQKKRELRADTDAEPPIEN